MSIQALHDALVVAFRTYSGSMIPVPDEHMGEQVRSVLQGILQNDMLVTRFENELTTEVITSNAEERARVDQMTDAEREAYYSPSNPRWQRR